MMFNYLKFRGGMLSDFTKNPNDEALYCNSPGKIEARNGTLTDSPHSLRISISPWVCLDVDITDAA